MPAPKIKAKHVRFVTTENIRRVRKEPRTVTVGEKTLYLQETRIFGRPEWSKPYKIGSPELKRKWAEYQKRYSQLMSKEEYRLYVDPQ